MRKAKSKTLEYSIKASEERAMKSGELRQMLRPRRRFAARAGDTLKFYRGRSKKNRRLVMTAQCVDVQTVEIYPDLVWVDNMFLTEEQLEEFAREIGLGSTAEFMKFFEEKYDLDYYNPLTKMELIRWEPI